MPTYDYKCAACGHRFEAFQSITAAALDKCPECGRKRLERLIGAGAGVIFKGSGFYQTDYKQQTDSNQLAGGDAKASGDAKTGESEGGCTPACGTKDAPAGCAQNRNNQNKKKE
jgi:putative FmdB family regulatory protein